jgi:hypothetical protein
VGRQPLACVDLQRIGQPPPPPPQGCYCRHPGLIRELCHATRT